MQHTTRRTTHTRAHVSHVTRHMSLVTLEPVQASSSSVQRKRCASLPMTCYCPSQHGSVLVSDPTSVRTPLALSPFLTRGSPAARLTLRVCDENTLVHPEQLWAEHWGMAFEMFYMQDNMCVKFMLHDCAWFKSLDPCVTNLVQVGTRRLACECTAASVSVGDQLRC